MTSKAAKAKGAERKQRMDTSSLMEQILSKDNLNVAYLQVVRNKGAAGVDGMTVEELGAYLSKNGENIREQLRTRKYKPQPVRRVEIPKPDGGTRNLGVPTVVDRFVQQAVAQVLTPIFEEQFHDHSYGFRPNRCAQQAVLKALEMMNEGHSWIVDIDLAKFFDTVDHDKLMTIFGRTIKDGDVISLVRKFLVSGVMIDDEYEDTIVGTPQGGNISPLLANIMLNELDKELEARGLDFVRYADDLIIMVGSKQAAERVMKSVTRFIENKLGLKVNAEKSKVDKPKGIKYLGFGFYYDSFAKGKTVELSDIEYNILLLLMKYPGKIFSAQNLYESVWNEPYFYNCNSTVMVHIRRLRVKIEEDPKNPRLIMTVWGKGYRFGEH